VDVVDLLILALRLVFVALLYLFLVLVLRVAVRELGVSGPPPVRSRPELRLVVVEPGATPLAAGEVLSVPEGATLGRGDAADLVLADTAISAEHARVERAGRRWVVRDLGSTNGTRVNDALVQKPARLAAGDVLTLGTVRLQVLAR
jgi:FHA domain-containing protein